MPKPQGIYANIIGYPGLNLEAMEYIDPKLQPYHADAIQRICQSSYGPTSSGGSRTAGSEGALEQVDACRSRDDVAAARRTECGWRDAVSHSSSIVKRYGAVAALAGVDLAVRHGELLTILGPSGSGKTTLLKIVAGFETARRRHGAAVDGATSPIAPPAKRGIGMVFQNYALFPHMTVARERRVPARDAAACARAEIERARRRGARAGRPAGLRRRAAARSCRAASSSAWRSRAPSCSSRELLLLDEPFGALDRKLREQMQLEVKRPAAPARHHRALRHA